MAFSREHTLDALARLPFIDVGELAEEAGQLEEERVRARADTEGVRG